MLFSFLPAAGTAAEEQPDSQAQVIDLPGAGLHFVFPEEFEQARGCITYSGGEEVSYGDGIISTALWYIGMTEEEVIAFLYNEAPTDEEIDRFNQITLPIAYIFSIDGGRNGNDLSDFFQRRTLTPLEGLVEIGQAEDVSFYLYYPELEDAAENLGEFKEEFLALISDPSLITGQLTLSVPKNRYAGAGSTLEFETVDIEGNPVSSADLFRQHKVTMVNIWASWCGPCVMELPDLEKLSQEYAEKGCAVVGLLYDGDDSGAVSDAVKIMADAGVTYTVLLPWEGAEYAYPVQAFPTTIFVDSEGTIIGDPVIGANVPAYTAELEKLLAE